LTAKFRELILVAEENYYATKGLVHRKEFQALGVTDVVLLEQMTSEHLFLTADFDLYAAARSKGVGVAINFNHYRDANPPE
jgi:hypothetical protein